LLERLGSDSRALNAERVSFGLIPRLNAAGRLDEAKLALDLLLTGDLDEARTLAGRLDELNRERQLLTQAALRAAREQLDEAELRPAVVLVGDFPFGILGLLAGRLAEALARPTIVLRRDGDVCSGSARSVPGCDVVGAIARGSAYLDRFGGHSMAAGLSLRAERLEFFEREFVEAVAEIRGYVGPEPALSLDAELQARTAVSWSTLSMLAQIEPCGSGNPPPGFLTRGLRVVDVRPRGNGVCGFRLAAADAVLEAVSFGRECEPPGLGERIDAAYRLKRREWRGLVSAEAELLDWRPAVEAASC
jgi:single-stranded-DNA-specific exonuclease